MLADDQGNRITYGEYEKIHEERAEFLEEGRLAFLYCRNTVGAVLYYRSCLRNHVVPLLLEHRMDRELLRTLIGTYEPDYLIGMPEDLAGMDGTVLECSECFGYQLAKRDSKRK